MIPHLEIFVIVHNDCNEHAQHNVDENGNEHIEVATVEVPDWAAVIHQGREGNKHVIPVHK